MILFLTLSCERDRSTKRISSVILTKRAKAITLRITENILHFVFVLFNTALLQIR